MLSKASDVYSFSIVMYEVLTWRIPYEDEPSRGQQLVGIVSRQRPAIPSDEQLYGGAPPPKYKELMEVRLGVGGCLSEGQSSRPWSVHWPSLEPLVCFLSWELRLRYMSNVTWLQLYAALASMRGHLYELCQHGWLPYI